MGRKNVLQPYPVIAAGSLALTLISTVTNVQQLDRVAYEVQWAGTGVTGTLFADAQVSGILNVWTPLDIDPMTVAADSGNHLITIECTDFVNVRLRYVPTAGTGVLNAYVAGSGVGA